MKKNKGYQGIIVHFPLSSESARLMTQTNHQKLRKNGGVNGSLSIRKYHREGKFTEIAPLLL